MRTDGIDQRAGVATSASRIQRARPQLQEGGIDRQPSYTLEHASKQASTVILGPMCARAAVCSTQLHLHPEPGSTRLPASVWLTIIRCVLRLQLQRCALPCRLVRCSICHARWLKLKPVRRYALRHRFYEKRNRPHYPYLCFLRELRTSSHVVATVRFAHHRGGQQGPMNNTIDDRVACSLVIDAALHS